MNNIQSIIFGVILLVYAFITLKIYSDHKIKKPYTNVTRFLVRIGIFGAMSAILYVVPFLKFSLVIFPSFLEIHFDEIPAFIAGFAYGPLSAIAVLAIKTIIKLPFTSTLTVGELSDFIFSLAFILPATLIYKKNRSFKNALLGLVVGTFVQLAVSLLGNIYLMIPFYMFMFNMSREQIVSIARVANPLIKDAEWTYGLYAVLPFNLLKDAIICVITLLVYKSTHKIIDRLEQ